jgi:O-6-methylguanine DNA methyltransferase
MEMKFTEKVYEVTREIPRGKVATYWQIALLVGSPKAARAVGMAMAKNPDVPNTPCHRVVTADGALHGYSGGEGIPTKRKMLLSEGVQFKNDKVDLSSSLWLN